MNRTIWAMLALLAMALAGGILMSQLVGDRPAIQAGEPPAIRLYEVPPDRGEEIRNSLRVILGGVDAGKPGALGQASLPFPNQLLVSAPAAMQPAIADAIAHMAEATPTKAEPATPERAIRVELWLARRGGPTRVDADESARQALAVAAAAGFSDFHLSQRAVGIVASNGLFEIGAVNPSIEMQLTPLGTDTISASVRVSLRVPMNGVFAQHGFNTRLPLKLGTWQLLGLMPAGAQDDEAGDVLLLIRAVDASDAAAHVAEH